MTITHSRLAAALGILAASAAACTRKEAPPAAQEWVLHVEPLASPAGPASAQPQLTSSEHGLILSWLENAGTTTTFKFAQRTATGWSDPRPIVSGSDFFVNFADVPSVVRLADRTLVAHWLQMSGTDPESDAYDVRLTRSNDDGRTWSPAFSPHHDGTKNEHGFATLFDVRGAGLGLVWLDGRAIKPSTTPGEDGVGDMSLRAAIYDRNWVERSEDAVDLRVCECCPTSAAVTSDGVVVAYRDRSPTEVRNIYVARLVDGKWTEPAPVHDDGWQIDGCPVNGPALGAAGRGVGVAWFTVQQDQGQARVAFSQDAGRTFGAPIRVDDAGSLGRVDLELLPDGSAVVSWIELAGSQAAFKVRRVERSGQRSAAVTVAEMGANRNSGYPRMARRGNEIVFAWTGTDDSLQVKTATARLP
jgi:hypothetical protein